MATTTEHYLLAKAAVERAGEWMDADTGWKGELTIEQRLAFRMADLAEAHVHATLALVVKPTNGKDVMW